MADITQLLRDVLSIDDQTKLIDGARTGLTNPFGASNIPGLLGRLVGSEEGMGLAQKALQKASEKNPTAREYIKDFGGQPPAPMAGGGMETLPPGPQMPGEEFEPQAGGGLGGILEMLLGQGRGQSIRQPVPPDPEEWLEPLPEAGPEPGMAGAPGPGMMGTPPTRSVYEDYPSESVKAAQMMLMRQGITPDEGTVRQFLESTQQ